MVLGPFDLIDVLVTDHTPPEPLRTALAAAGVEVVVASEHQGQPLAPAGAHQAHRQGGSNGGDRGMCDQVAAVHLAEAGDRPGVGGVEEHGEVGAGQRRAVGGIGAGRRDRAGRRV